MTATKPLRSILTTATQLPFLRNILLMTLFSVALVPLYSLFVNHPQYEQLLVRITEDEAARLGGDEFAIVLHQVLDAAAPQRVADKIIVAINEPVFVEGHQCHVGTSIGIAPDHADEAEALVELADAAMYAAKKGGRNCYSVHGGG
jgi:hypothetical protein